MKRGDRQEPIFPDDETGISGQTKIVRLAYDELESALSEQWNKRGQPCGTDLFSRPAGCLSASGLEWVVTVFSPVGLDEDAVDLFKVDNTGLIADGFDERTEAQIACATK